jgi:regulator of protease activity HflC (stomatin/prohibitin superfamily)
VHSGYGRTPAYALNGDYERTKAMALVKKAIAPAASSTPAEGRTSAVATREAEAQRKRARTLAKQQQAAERIAAATGQLASGISEASSAAEQLKRASEAIVIISNIQRIALRC